MPACPVEEMVGKTFYLIEYTESEIKFLGADYSYALYHDQDCCESVYLNDVVGDLSDLQESPILIAEEAHSRMLPPNGEYDESWTWTFYKFSTIKGSVTLRWYGTSNGYYSESVTCHRCNENVKA